MTKTTLKMRKGCFSAVFCPMARGLPGLTEPVITNLVTVSPKW